MHADDHGPGGVIVRRVDVTPVGGVCVQGKAVIIVLGKKVQARRISTAIGRWRKIRNRKQFGSGGKIHEFGLDRSEGLTVHALTGFDFAHRRDRIGDCRLALSGSGFLSSGLHL